jgi:mono/diheme cytochrome c family protein
MPNIRAAILGLAVLGAGSMVAGTGSVWDGVYSKAQAKRGQDIYMEQCSKCHGENMGGGEGSPAIAGDEFVGRWSGKTAGALFQKIRKTMPTDDPGNLSTRQCADVLAYIFSVNGFPAGEKELDHDATALNGIHIEAKK